MTLTRLFELVHNSIARRGERFVVHDRELSNARHKPVGLIDVRKRPVGRKRHAKESPLRFRNHFLGQVENWVREQSIDQPSDSARALDHERSTGSWPKDCCHRLVSERRRRKSESLPDCWRLLTRSNFFASRKRLHDAGRYRRCWRLR